MDADHPDIAAAVEATPHAPVGFGGVQDAANSIATLVQAVLQNHIISKASTLLDNLIAASGNANAATADIAKIVADFKTVADLIPVAIAWIKAEFAPHNLLPRSNIAAQQVVGNSTQPNFEHLAVGFFRRPPLPVPGTVDAFAQSPTFMSHYNNTSAELNQIKSIVMAEAALSQTIATAVTTLVNHPVISPDQAAALTASLKASAAKLEAAVNAAPHPS